MNILQINTVYKTGSTGRIVFDLKNVSENSNFKCYVGYYKTNSLIKEKRILKIGGIFSFYIHALLTRIFDIHGFGSYLSTKKFLKKIEKLDIQLVHLHNIHGYYINFKVLFQYLKKKNLPVIWTLHDCWSFTGHCAHYQKINCTKWQNECFSCPQISSYPSSLYYDNSKFNYYNKKKYFLSINNLTLVPVSKWLETQLKKSYFKHAKINQIYNGVDLNKFNPDILSKDYTYNNKIKNRKYILGISNVWNESKGFFDFIQLSEYFPKEYVIVLIGLTKNQIKNLPDNIFGIEKTENIEELIYYYSNAIVLFNPTYEDTYPTVNLEAISCGLPVVTYNSGGSPESINKNTGFIIDQKDFKSLINIIIYIDGKRDQFRNSCRNYAILNFNQDIFYNKYLDLYKSIISNIK